MLIYNYNLIILLLLRVVEGTDPVKPSNPRQGRC